MPTLAADSIPLKPKYAGPTTVYASFDTESVQKTTGPDGKPMDIKTRSFYGLIEDVASKGDAIEIRATLDRLTGYMSFSPAIASVYDTDAPDSEDASPDYKAAFTPILDKPMKIVIGADGLARSIEGGEAIRKELTDLGPQNFVAKSLSDEDMSDAQLKAIFGELPFALFANRDVKPGDTWKQTRHEAFGQAGRAILTYECKLDRIEKSDNGEIAIVTFSGTVAKDPDEKPAENKRPSKIDGSITGIGRFDVQRGAFVEVRREINSKIEVPPWWSQDPDAPMMKLEIETKQVYSIAPVGDRIKAKSENRQRIAAAEAAREAEEAAALAEPADPVTAANAPTPWLQWGGPDRNFCSSATGLANRWPKDGPPKLWERPLGDGFSAIVSDIDTLYTQYSIRDKDDAFKGDEVVVALDAKTGETRWEHRYAAPWPKDLQMEFGPGPHSTPLLVGDRLFAIGSTAKLHCLDKKTGKVIWSHDLHEKYKASLQMRGYGSSPLAFEDKIILPVSKEGDNALMAFNQSDGSVAWHGGDFSPGYASLLAITSHGVKQLIAFSGSAVMGLDPKDGRKLWSVDHPTQWGANISTPVWCGADNLLFVSSAYGMGSRGIELEMAGSQPAAKEIWFNPKLKIQHGDAVRVGDWVYGSSGDFGPAFFACVNARNGKMGWRQRGISKANVLSADGKLIVFDEDGQLVLIKADPEKYRLLAKTKGLCKKTAWTVPTLVGRTLYLRDREKILALDLGVGKDAG
ncbi:MAG: PQQ-like beta-propeller repeat protein [Phycisphaerae bacterium]|nr:PQQ-like beta-propeller repeat protein [Phycisphaerae bacterium]